jgi:hypothetical protein
MDLNAEKDFFDDGGTALRGSTECVIGGETMVIDEMGI